MKIEKSIALITGGASGIGLATAERFLSENAIVYICDYDKTNLELVKNKHKDNPNLHCVYCDVSNENDIIKVFDLIKTQHKRLDIVVSNAGISGLPDSTKSDVKFVLDNYIKIYKINLLGCFLVAKHAAKLMIDNYDKSKGCNGVIVMISSIFGIEAPKGFSSYAASKGGVIGMTKPMARDLGRYNIRVNTICPGTIDTAIIAPVKNTKPQMLGVSSTPISRIGVPDEVAKVVESMVVNDFMNSAIIRIDGGITVGHF